MSERDVVTLSCCLGWVDHESWCSSNPKNRAEIQAQRRYRERAVNSHEALVSALREVLMTTVNGHPVWESIAPTVAIKAKAALKKAEGL